MPIPPTVMRRSLAALRLGLYYALLCALLLAAGVQQRADLEGGSGQGAAPAQDAPGMAIPLPGVTVELEAATPAERQAALTALRAAGFGWVRQRFDWGAMEPAPGEFDWHFADDLIAAVTAAGLVPVAVLDGSPVWARAPQDRPPTDNPLAPPAAPADFARFAQAFAARYGDDVQYYQLWDEPNIAPHWGNRHVEPVAYAQLLVAASRSIRQADPGAVILTAALAPTTDRGHTAIDEGYFLQRMLAAGAGPHFDVVALQPFGFGHAAENARQTRTVLNFQRAAWVRRVLVAAGLGDKPVWAARFGWNRTPNATWGAVTPPVQAQETVAALNLAWQRWPWLAAMGWAVDRPASAPGTPAWGFALTDPAGLPTPLLAALRHWQPPAQPASTPAGGPAGLAWVVLAWAVLAAAFGLIVWRSYAAARLLPWAKGRAWFLRRGRWWQMGAWLLLLVVYFFATWPPLIGLCWLVWALLCLAQPGAGLGLAALLLPFSFQHKELSLVDVTLTVPPAVAATLCLAPALAWQVWRHPLRLARVDWAMLLLFAVTLLSAAGVWQWEAYGRGVVELVLAPLLLWFAVRTLVRGARRRREVALALFAGGLLVALWGLVAWWQGFGVAVDDVRRLVGPHFSPNHSALYLVRTLFLGLGLALAAANRRRRLLLAAAALVLAALLLTGSRGALLLGLPAGLALFAGLALRRRRELPVRVWRWWPWVLAGGVLLAAMAGTWLWDRLANLETVALRLELWAASLRLWWDFPWSGVGPGGFFWRYPAYLAPGALVEPNQLHPHNLWLELLATWGIAGLVWLALLLSTLAGLLRRVPTLPTASYWLTAGVLAGLTAGVAHAQVDAFFSLADLAAWNAVALALAVTAVDGDGECRSAPGAEKVGKLLRVPKK